MEERTYNFILDLKNITEDKKLIKTADIRKEVYELYLFAIIDNKKGSNRKYIDILAQFLTYCVRHKRIGVKRINGFIDRLNFLL